MADSGVFGAQGATGLTPGQSICGGGVATGYEIHHDRRPGGAVRGIRLRCSTYTVPTIP